MSTSVTWNGVTYSVPAAGEVGWASLSDFLVALGNNAAIAQEMKQAVRVATTSPVTVSDTTDCVIATNLAVAGAVTVNLPAGTDGRWFVVVDQKGDANTNNITINRNGSDTINGATSYVINDNNGGVILVYSATNTRWNVVGRYIGGSVLVNPMDSAGDMIYGGTGGVATRLESGTLGQWLVSQGAASPNWTNTVTTGKVIDGSADEIQLRVQAHSTQTNDVFVVEQSTGTNLFDVNNSGLGTFSGGVSIPGAASVGNVLSGTYTPTLTNVANTTARTASAFSYVRVGNVVTVSGHMAITATASATLTQVGISLPIASNFTTANQCTGSGCVESPFPAVMIIGDATNDRAEAQWTAAAAASRDMRVTFQYQIL